MGLLAENGFAPVDIPPLADGIGLALYDKFPRLTPFTMVAPGRHVLGVGLPSLVKVLEVAEDLTAGAVPGAELQMGWRLDGESGDTLTSPAQSTVLPFFGPYAYLPGAGQYEILANGIWDGAGSLRVRLMLAHGVSLEEWLAISGARPARFVTTRAVTLVAGVTQHVSDFPRAFPQYRALRAINTGTQNATLSIGPNSDSIIIRIAGGAETTIDEPYLSRHSIRAVSAMGTSLQTILSYW